MAYRTILLWVLSFLLMSFFPCYGQTADSGVKSGHELKLSAPPDTMTDPISRAVFVAQHYWDNFDFSDDTWIDDKDALEQVFADWAWILSQMPVSESKKVVGDAIRKGNGAQKLQYEMMYLSEFYFQNPNSPYRNDDLYIEVLNAVLADDKIDDGTKLRAREQLKTAMLNRPGTKASEFTGLTAKDNKKIKLSKIKGEYIVLYFFNPECHDCERVRGQLNASATIAPLLESGKLTIVAVYPEEDLTVWERHTDEMPLSWITLRFASEEDRDGYDLLSIPTLYLLNEDKQVILKDASVESIEAYIKQNSETAH